ncbi:efflux transporter outer membrane subunit [Erythrobacter sp. NE805]|uniref:efflux transporter outer membrane subunit n=1 Tax=Erythrobacter sp. NE805 TaxID=3389875 RepID=UPI00396AF475
MLLPALLLSGCATGALPAPTDPGIAVPDRLPSQPADAAAPTPLDRWWARFGEPPLDALVAMLASDNPDLAAARARYEAARKSAIAERAGLFPQLSASASSNRTVAGDTQPGSGRSIYQAELSASWEIDLFGGLRASARAADAEARASAADYGDQRRALIGSLARSYVDERLAAARIALTEDLLVSQRQTRQIAAWRVQAGLATGLDNEQARQLVLGTEAQLPALAADRRSAANRLAVLSGRTPGAIDELIGAGTGIPAPLDVAPLTPVEIVRRRPDLRAAEANLAAALAQVGVARAALLPRLSLSGSLGGSGSGLGKLADAVGGSIGALIDQVLFDGGRNRANLAAQKARAEAALQDYRSALLAALEDVDNAYAALAAARERLALRRGVETATGNAARILRQQYAAGVVDFRDLLDAEQNLVTASDQRVQAEADVTRAAITLIQALGGDDPLASPKPEQPT